MAGAAIIAAIVYVKTRPMTIQQASAILNKEFHGTPQAFFLVRVNMENSDANVIKIAKWVRDYYIPERKAEPGALWEFVRDWCRENGTTFLISGLSPDGTF